MRRTKYLSLQDWFDYQGIRQREAARRLGMSEAYFSMLLAGKRRLSVDKAKEVARATGIPIAYLLELGKAA